MRRFDPRRFPDLLLVLDVAFLVVLIPLLGTWFCLVCLVIVPAVYYSLWLLTRLLPPGRLRTGIFLAGWLTVVLLLTNTAFFRIPLSLPRWPLLFMGLKIFHYGWDVLAGKTELAGLRRLANLLLFFPTLFWGPIERYEHLVPQVSGAAERVTRKETIFGFRHLGEGLLKVAICLTIFYLAPQYTIDLYKMYQTYTFFEVLLGVYLIIIAFFFVVAGYSDCAIGLASLMGIEVFENFRNPYMKHNFAQFWRTWHISYSFWLRDYVYVRLGGNRSRVYRNTILTFLFSGISHGLDLKFVIWALIAGLCVCVMRWWHRLWAGELGGVMTALKEWAGGHPVLIRTMGMALTFHCFTLSMMIFFGGLRRGTEVILTVLSLGLIKQVM
ncbi:MBOAT family O-acyltransferase [Thermodesulfobacteriota bacterium]